MRLFRIKADKLQKFLDWGEVLQNSKEAIETLKEENIKFEGFYYFHLNNEYYTIGVSDNPNPKPAKKRDINQKHTEILKDCLEPITQVMPVYTLKDE